MDRPGFDKLLTIAVVAVFFAWIAIRALGARPAETPDAALFPKPAIDAPLANSSKSESAIFAGGCFWGVQAVFEHVRGLRSVTSGYSGGHTKSPSYELVSLGVTGHAESVQVTYDPSQLTYGELLMVYFSVAHDPTQLNRQGPDAGSQYRSTIFYSNDEQKRIANAYIAQLDSAAVYSHPIVTTVVPFEAFYPAEDYHQDYLKKNPDNPYIIFNDLPKLQRLKKEFPTMYRPTNVSGSVVVCTSPPQPGHQLETTHLNAANGIADLGLEGVLCLNFAAAIRQSAGVRAELDGNIYLGLHRLAIHQSLVKLPFSKIAHHSRQ